MRKIKELEKRIEELERLKCHDKEYYEHVTDDICECLTKVEIKQKEQEEFLKKTVAPFIADALLEEFGDGLAGIATALNDALVDLFAETPKKRTKKEPKCEKNKMCKQKQKKENK